MAGLVVLLLGAALAAPQRDQGSTEVMDACRDFNTFGFYCVPIFQCNADGLIKTDAAGLFDPRSSVDVVCDPNDDYVDDTPEECCPPSRPRALDSSCPGSLEVCCLHVNSTEQYKETNLAAYNCNPGGGFSNEVEIFECDQIFGCKEESPACSQDDEELGFCQNERNEPLGATEPPRSGRVPRDRKNGPQCGRRNPEGTASVPIQPAADEAEFGEWPHMCAILKKEYIGSGDPLKIYQCGASLIDAGILLTAAHCLDGFSPSDLIVRCGEWNTQNEDEPEPYQEIQVADIKVHPGFNIANHHNNFGLLFVERDFQMARHIYPICLPQPCAEYTQENCVANGWGKDKFGSAGRYQKILKEIVYPIVSHAQCQDDLRKTRLGQFFELDDSFICAGGVKGVDTCKGDGGSPLTCRIQVQGSDRWVQAGIVSWGIGCGEQGTPAVYASVAAEVCWIDNEVKKFFGLPSKESRFGFLQTVDCNGALPARQCNSFTPDYTYTDTVDREDEEDFDLFGDDEYDDVDIRRQPKPTSY